MIGRTIVAASLLLVLCASICAQDAVKSKGSILPPDDAPSFVKKQWADIAVASLFKMPSRNWEEVGLPPGLEEQVWEAWAPDAPRRWKNVSPGYTNVIYDAKVDNGAISLLLDGAGLVQSADGGETWRPVSHHLSLAGRNGYASFDISPADPRVIAIGGSAIDRSLDGGRTWSPVMDPALPPFAVVPVAPGQSGTTGVIAFGSVRFNADGSRVFASPGGFGHDYADRGGVEAEMAAKLKRKLVFAGDGSVANFKALDLGPFAGIRCILPHWSDPDLVYASFSDGSVYVCRNAKAANPAFVALAMPASLKDLQAICMDVSPSDPGTLLLTMSERGASSGWPKSKIILAKVAGTALECREIIIRSPNEYLDFSSAKWDPRDPNRVFVGNKHGQTALRVSEDGMKSFARRELPALLFPPEHTMAYSSLRSFAFDRKSSLSIVYSVTGAWSSRDGFKTVDELVMTHDEDMKLYGNKGVGFAECGMSIFIRGDRAYMATTDHGAWRRDGRDAPMWRKISDKPGMPRSGRFRLAYPMAVSEDESVIYLVSRLDDWSDSSHKLMRSRDRGETWEDATAVLGEGDIVRGGIQWILIDPADSRNQWIFASQRLFISDNGGKSFKSSTGINQHQVVAFDPRRKILYASDYGKILRSVDMGFTWKALPASFSGMVYSLGVLENGDLAAADDGRLLVIPFGRIDTPEIEQDMIRLTIGESVADAACGLRTFKPIVCRGSDILTFTDDGWNGASSVRNLGPLLSRDGGRTFSWIVYDLPCGDGSYGVDFRDDRIIIGNRGIHQLDLR